ncbi:hypothetical protein [Nocardia transvalensis]|uniref:hypothetical protein n=1 Tax=Nocardia transvalensis TaxID=37333 RepID=UPI001895DB3A|nr:hypothetical protein [Nocardia transvalensis]MBF6329968.1 hypothetical protein [Nocardia transvalensis]
MTNPQDEGEYSDEVPIKPDKERKSGDRDDKADEQDARPEAATDTVEGVGEPPD